MIDHMTLTVRDFDRSAAFYERVLAPLGYRILMQFEEIAGFGDEKPYFWMKAGDPPTNPQHIAFVARRRADVDAFYEAAIAAGARDNGAPGLRPDYHPSYYAAFVFDPDGHPIEAVNHREPAARRTRPRPARKARKAAALRPARANRKARKAPARRPASATRKAPRGRR
jgi:catechol 2,3-dioxygenase-like lactoylglutathione lyase family enzyme